MKLVIKFGLFSLIILLFLCEPSFAQVGGTSPIRFQKAMIFIDGTNLFYRLESLKIIVPDFVKLVRPGVGSRQLVRTYLYTIKEHYEKALAIHGEQCFKGIRTVFGQGIPLKDGNVKEKGVDALLVADLIYHAANKNIDHAVLVSVDTDFVHAIQRVEDFGCRTGVLAIGSDAPERLRLGCDEYQFWGEEQIINAGYARRKQP